MAGVVATVIAEGFERDERIDADRRDLAERQFNARLSAYRDALGARVPDASVRLGQTLLAFSGGSFRDVDANVRRVMGALEASVGNGFHDVPLSLTWEMVEEMHRAGVTIGSHFWYSRL